MRIRFFYRHVRTVSQRPGSGLPDPFFCSLDIVFLHLCSRKAASFQYRRRACCARPEEGVHDQIAFCSQGMYQPLGENDRILARMSRLFHMISLYIRDVPYVVWRQPVDIPANIPFRKPQDRLMPSGKPMPAVQAVTERPDDPSPAHEGRGMPAPQFCKQVVDLDIQRHYFAFCYVTPHLPAYAPGRLEDTVHIFEYALMQFPEFFQACAAVFVFPSHTVWRGRHYKVCAAIRHAA